jgi:hypothetical protein
VSVDTCTWNTDFAISKPIVLISPMDGSPQVVRFDATTLWHSMPQSGRRPHVTLVVWKVALL